MSASTTPDRSGNYRVDLCTWMGHAWDRLDQFWFVPALLFLPLMAIIHLLENSLGRLLGDGVWLLAVLLLRPIWFGGLFLIAVHGLRGNFKNFDVFWRACVSPRLLLANLLSSGLWLLLWNVLVVADHVMKQGIRFRNINESIPLAILAFYFHVRFWFAHLLILDANSTILGAFRDSWRLTRHHVLGLSGFLLLLAAILFVGASFCGIGFLVALAFVILAEASAYLHATGQMRPQHPEGKP